MAKNSKPRRDPNKPGVYAIICDPHTKSQREAGFTVLALVDKEIAGTGSHWWTGDDPGIMMDYSSERGVRFALGRLRRDNARIVPFAEAEAQIILQAENRRATASPDRGVIDSTVTTTPQITGPIPRYTEEQMEKDFDEANAENEMGIGGYQGTAF